MLVLSRAHQRLVQMSLWGLLVLSLPVQSQAAGPIGSPFHPWLVTKGRLSLVSAHHAVIVLVHGDFRYTVAPAYLLNRMGMQEEPSLLLGLPKDTRFTKEQNSKVTGTTLAGEVSISGTWPNNAQLVINETPDGGCAGCWQEYRWHAHRWVPVKHREWLPVWLEPSGGAPSSSVRFSNGTSLWERFEISSTLYYPQGTSAFYADPYGRRVARRQRTRGPTACEGGVRLRGRFSGVPLTDGGLFSVGANCETQIGEAEYWRAGSVRSRVVELHGHPIGPIIQSIFHDPTAYLVRSPKDVVVAFTAGMPDGEERRPYVAAFDGTTFADFSPPFRGELGPITRLSDGSLWATQQSEPEALWFHPGLSNTVEGWQDVTPKGIAQGRARFRGPYFNSKN
jgi:hypothetical protein